MTLLLHFGIFAFGLFCIIRPDYILDRSGEKKKREYEKRDKTVIRLFGAGLILVSLVGFLSAIGGYYYAD